MNRNLRIFFLCLGVVFFSSLTYGYSDQEEQQLAFQRSRDAQSCVESAWKIARDMKDPDITKIVAFMQDRIGLAVPGERSSIKVVELPKRAKMESLYVIPLYKSDAQLGGVWKEVVEHKKMHAGYFKFSDEDDYSIIVLPHVGGSYLSKGLTLIHEGAHAFAEDAKMFSNIPQSLQKCAEHAWIWEIEGRALAYYGKEKYEELLKAEADRIENFFKKYNGNIPTLGESYPALENLFHTNSEDSDTFEIILWVNASFRAIAKMNPKMDLIQLKRDVVCSMSKAEALNDVVKLNLK